MQPVVQYVHDITTTESPYAFTNVMWAWFSYKKTLYLGFRRTRTTQQKLGGFIHTDVLSSQHTHRCQSFLAKLSAVTWQVSPIYCKCAFKFSEDFLIMIIHILT